MTTETPNTTAPEASTSYEGYTLMEHTFNDRFAGKEVTIRHHFKRPNRPQISRAQKGAGKDAMKAFGNFVSEIVHPDEKEALAANIKTYPGLAATFGNAIMGAVGVGDLGN